MARRYVPILLAAKMQFRLGTFEEALANGDLVRAEREADALTETWSKFGHSAQDTHGTLCDRVLEPVAAISTGIRTTPIDQRVLTEKVGELNRLLKQLAS